MEQERIFLSMGSNMGDKKAHLQQGLAALTSEIPLQIIQKASLYETPPFGYTEQDVFLNTVVEITTTVEPSSLLTAIHRAEAACGRERLLHWGPRTLDIDILLYGQRLLTGDFLTLPHPGIPQRHFVLLPWAEIAPEVMVGDWGTVSDLLAALPPTNDIRKIAVSW